MQDYYWVLGLPRTASMEENRDAYRRHATRYHPDHNPEAIDAERFRAIQEAYEVLGDRQRKRDHDLKLVSEEARGKIDEGSTRPAWSAGAPTGWDDTLRPPVWPKDAASEPALDEALSWSEARFLGHLRHMLARFEEMFFDERKDPNRPAGPVRW